MCYYSIAPTVGVGVSWTPGELKQNLRTLYTSHARGLDTGNRWEELAVSGYPAMTVQVEDNLPSRQDKGPLACTLALGVDDNTLVKVRADTRENDEAGPWQNDLCGAVKKIAEFVVENLRA